MKLQSKLNLTKETLRSLDAKEAEDVAGAYPYTRALPDGGCWSDACVSFDTRVFHPCIQLP